MRTTAQYELPELDYALDALTPVCTEETLELHHGAHHAGYVKGANKALSDLAEARQRSDYATLNQLQKDLAFNVSGHMLHSMFWQNMSPKGGGSPRGSLEQAMAQSFGDTDSFREQFSRAATSIQGSGWAALCYEPMSKSLIVEQIYDHQGNMGSGCVPLLVLDMWEHAFYLQYRNKKQSWVDSFWNVVNWSDVAARMESVEPIDLHLAA
jgi:Fe-Mn family superoxide dismutase